MAIDYLYRTSTLPETILQFGSGKFLRAFVDFFVHEANLEGQEVGRIVVVQSTGRQRSDAINRQKGRYQVFIRGLQRGEPVDESVMIESISRAIYSGTDWDAVLDTMARDPIRYIISNTSEVGYNLSDSDGLSDAPPDSFPAKLLQVLHTRYEGSQAAITVIPCELIDENAHQLRQIVVDLARRWRLSPHFFDWMHTEVIWLRTLVDRITIDPPEDHPQLAADPLLTITEPFAFWALERHPQGNVFLNHHAMIQTDDVKPYALRKVRILNGAHTALVCRAMPMGIQTVKEAMEHPDVGRWIRDVLFTEIIPALPDEVESPVIFAENCIERFLNPYLNHHLQAIAFEHDTKVKVRLVPTYNAYIEKFGHAPPLLHEIMGDCATESGN